MKGDRQMKITKNGQKTDGERAFLTHNRKYFSFNDQAEQKLNFI